MLAFNIFLIFLGVVCVAMYPRERRRLRRLRNLRGFTRGYGACLCCRDTWDWKDEHTTHYSEPGAWPSEACFALCEECWAALTPEERLPYYDQLVEIWIVGSSEPSDRQALYRAALGSPSEYEEKRAQIHKAVLAGL
jgi:hypothetical protein